MELYILDDNLRRTEVIDRFESLIWTERFQAHGDFQLTLYSTREIRSLIPYGTIVATNKSHRIMIVDELENKTDADGRKILSIKGSSMEKTLQDRVASNGLSNLYSVTKGSVAPNIALDTFTNVGHNLITGDEIYFESTGILTKTQKGSIVSVSIADNTLKFENHSFVTGDAVYLTTSGTLPTGITSGTTYYVIVVNGDLFKLATTANNAKIETAIDLTAVGSGTHTLFSNLKIDRSYWAVVQSSSSFKIATSYEDAMTNNNLVSLDGTSTGTHTLFWVNKGKWRVTGLPVPVIETIFQAFCITGVLDSTDTMPNYVSGTVYDDVDTILPPTISSTIDIEITSVYDVIKQLCEINGLGFRITRNDSLNKLHFNVYTGSNRTTSQTIKPPIVFDAGLDNLLSDTEYTSTKNVKNVAYVFAPNGYKTVYAANASNNTTGLNKHVLFVNASDITTEAGTTLDAQLEQRGMAELNKYRTMVAFDGEVPQYGSFIYDVNYRLGDLVEVRNNDGYADNKRVTEQIFADDMSGEKSYPTLSSELVVTPGTWVSWNSDQTWDNIPDDLDHEWQDLP